MNDVNEAPGGLTVSASEFDENIPGGAAVASFSSADVDAGDTMPIHWPMERVMTITVHLLLKDQLKIIRSPDFEAKSSYSIRLQTKDSGGLTFEKAFQLTVNDLEEMPAIQSIEDISTQKKVKTFKIQEPVAFESKEVDTVIVGTKKKDKITGTSDGETLLA